jgi:hypothetical protein
MKIIGGSTALPHSWPSMAIIKISYKLRTFNPHLNQTRIETYDFECGGSLIDRKTVLTAAHCIMYQINREAYGNNFRINIVPNEFYSTYESIYTVYLGVHNQTAIQQNNSNIGYEVKRVKRVYF